MDNIPVYFIMSLLLGFIGAQLLFFQAKWNYKKDSRYFYCVKCGKQQIDSKDNHCKCGGEIVNVNLLKWVQMPEELMEQNESTLN